MTDFIGDELEKATLDSKKDFRRDELLLDALRLVEYDLPVIHTDPDMLRAMVKNRAERLYRLTQDPERTMPTVILVREWRLIGRALAGLKDLNVPG